MNHDGELILGVAINDMGKCDTKLKRKAYCRWYSMIYRCYGKRNYSNKSYGDVHVCNEWLRRSNFDRWLKSHENWEDLALDKDLLFPGNKEYSPEKCLMIPLIINKFIISYTEKNGRMMGVHFRRDCNKYMADCASPFDGKNSYLGLFETKDQAHEAWKAKKIEYAYMLADLVVDKKIADALRSYYPKLFNLKNALYEAQGEK